MSQSFKILLSIFGLSLLGLVLFLLWDSSQHPDREDEPVASDDPQLKELQANNSHLRIERRLRDTKQYFWGVELKGGRTVLLPKSITDDNAVIELRTCDFSSIPPRVLYPHALDSICLHITADFKQMDALQFVTADSEEDLIRYYDEHAFNYRRVSNEGSSDPKEPHWVFNYAFHTGKYEGKLQTFAVVVYRKESIRRSTTHD